MLSAAQLLLSSGRGAYSPFRVFELISRRCSADRTPHSLAPLNLRWFVAVFDGGFEVTARLALSMDAYWQPERPPG